MRGLSLFTTARCSTLLYLSLLTIWNVQHLKTIGSVIWSVSSKLTPRFEVWSSNTRWPDNSEITYSITCNHYDIEHTPFHMQFCPSVAYDTAWYTKPHGIPITADHTPSASNQVCYASFTPVTVIESANTWSMSPKFTTKASGNGCTVNHSWSLYTCRPATSSWRSRVIAPMSECACIQPISYKKEMLIFH